MTSKISPIFPRSVRVSREGAKLLDDLEEDLEEELDDLDEKLEDEDLDDPPDEEDLEPLEDAVELIEPRRAPRSVAS